MSKYAYGADSETSILLRNYAEEPLAAAAGVTFTHAPETEVAGPQVSGRMTLTGDESLEGVDHVIIRGLWGYSDGSMEFQLRLEDVVFLNELREDGKRHCDFTADYMYYEVGEVS